MRGIVAFKNDVYLNKETSCAVKKFLHVKEKYNYEILYISAETSTRWFDSKMAKGSNKCKK